MKKNFSEMSELAQEVAVSIDSQIYDCKDLCQKGTLVGSMRACIIRTVQKTLDNWTPQLSYRTRCEILDWLQSEYGLCL